MGMKHWTMLPVITFRWQMRAFCADGVSTIAKSTYHSIALWCVCHSDCVYCRCSIFMISNQYIFCNSELCAWQVMVLTCVTMCSALAVLSHCCSMLMLTLRYRSFAMSPGRCQTSVAIRTHRLRLMLFASAYLHSHYLCITRTVRCCLTPAGLCHT